MKKRDAVFSRGMFLFLLGAALLYAETYLVTDLVIRIIVAFLGITVLLAFMVYTIVEAPPPWKRSYPHVPWFIRDAPIDDPDERKKKETKHQTKVNSPTNQT